MKTSVGILLHDPAPGFGTDNYSTTTTDTFGHMTIVPRSFRKWMTGTVHIDNDYIDEISHLLDLYLNIPLVWIFSVNYSVLIDYGFWESTDTAMGVTHTDMALTINGIV
jgi:hypothetical protein